MSDESKSKLVFRASGLFFFLWWICNTYLDVVRYGIHEGFYWWFCNLALLGTSMGLFFRHRGWLTGFLSIACFTQIFWVIDNVYRVLTHENLFGLVEFMYQPGLPLDEFYLSHYHYFTIPVCIIALFYLPKKNSNALTLISIFNPLIFGVSYFAFPARQNVNCIHTPCFPGLDYLAGPMYSFTFWFVIFLMHLAIGYSIENWFRKHDYSALAKMKAVGAFAVSIFAALFISYVDIGYKKSLPRFECRQEQNQTGAEASCGFTLDGKPNEMAFVYRLKNKEREPKVCAVMARTRDITIPLQHNIVLGPNAEMEFRTFIEYPKHNLVTVLSADCGNERMPAQSTK